MMYWYGDHHPGAGGWLLMSVLTLLFWVAVFGATYALLRAALERGKNPPKDTRSDARRLLDERLARGGIDADDYARRRDLLDRSESSRS
jgi:putative membrane protein